MRRVGKRSAETQHKPGGVRRGGGGWAWQVGAREQRENLRHAECCTGMALVHDVVVRVTYEAIRYFVTKTLPRQATCKLSSDSEPSDKRHTRCWQICSSLATAAGWRNDVAPLASGRGRCGRRRASAAPIVRQFAARALGLRRAGEQKTATLFPPAAIAAGGAAVCADGVLRRAALGGRACDAYK